VSIRFDSPVVSGRLSPVAYRSCSDLGTLPGLQHNLHCCWDGRSMCGCHSFGIVIDCHCRFDLFHRLSPVHLISTLLRWCLVLAIVASVAAVVAARCCGCRCRSLSDRLSLSIDLFAFVNCHCRPVTVLLCGYRCRLLSAVIADRLSLSGIKWVPTAIVGFLLWSCRCPLFLFFMVGNFAVSGIPVPAIHSCDFSGCLRQNNH
jgi:hypothetical protein